MYYHNNNNNKKIDSEVISCTVICGTSKPILFASIFSAVNYQYFTEFYSTKLMHYQIVAFFLWHILFCWLLIVVLSSCYQHYQGFYLTQCQWFVCYNVFYVSFVINIFFQFNFQIDLATTFSLWKININMNNVFDALL